MVWALFLWAAATFAAVCTPKLFWEHYFLQMLPPVSLLAALIWHEFLLFFRPPLGWKARLFLVMICAMAVASVALPPVRSGLRFAYHRWIRAERHWGDTAALVAERLRQKTTPEDYIYVVDYESVVYYLAPARIPTRHPFCNGLIMDHFSMMAGIDPLRELEAILQKEPRYIIKHRNPDYARFEARGMRANRDFLSLLQHALDTKYTLEDSIDVVYLYRNREGRSHPPSVEREGGRK